MYKYIIYKYKNYTAQQVAYTLSRRQLYRAAWLCWFVCLYACMY